jgi:hypothetical protein
MWINVLALATASSTNLATASSTNLATASSTDLVASSKLAVDSKAEIDAILALQFAEPLPNVLKRAQKASKTMHVDEALKSVGHKMTKI